MKYISILVIFLALYGCRDEKVKPKVDLNLRAEKLPVQESWGSTIIFTDSGYTAAILKTGHLRMFAETQESLLDDNVKVDFYNTNKVITTTLTSKRGRVNDATKDLYAYDSVVARSNEGTVVTTEELMWRNSDRKIVSDKFVTIVSPKEKIQGYGFESDQHLKNYQIKRNVTIVTQSAVQK